MTSAADDSTSDRSGALSGARDAGAPPRVDEIVDTARLDRSSGDSPGGDAARRPAPRRRAARRSRPAWQEALLLVASALLMALLIKSFLVQAFYIPSGSMRNTLQVDDRIVVQKWSYWFGEIERGDIVVFDDPAHWLGEEDVQTSPSALGRALSTVGLSPTGGHLVKRVSGVAGDTVACRQGSVMVNGTALQERSYVTVPRRACSGSWTVEVPDERIWVLGDNRRHSADSRVHIGDPGGGFIPVDDVVGKVVLVVWPVSRWGVVHRPGTFDDVAVDAAAGLVSSTAPVGLALAALPLLARRARKRTSD